MTKGKFYCLKHKSNHFYDSKIGMKCLSKGFRGFSRVKQDKNENDSKYKKYNLQYEGIVFHDDPENPEKSERMNEQAREILKFANEKGFKFTSNKDFPLEFGSIDIKLKKNHRESEIRVFPVGESVDYSIRKKNVPYLIQSHLRDVNLKTALKYIDEVSRK